MNSHTNMFFFAYLTFFSLRLGRKCYSVLVMRPGIAKKSLLAKQQGVQQENCLCRECGERFFCQLRVFFLLQVLTELIFYDLNYSNCNI